MAYSSVITLSASYELFPDYISEQAFTLDSLRDKSYAFSEAYTDSTDSYDLYGCVLFSTPQMLTDHDVWICPSSCASETPLAGCPDDCFSVETDTEFLVAYKLYRIFIDVDLVGSDDEWVVMTRQEVSTNFSSISNTFTVPTQLVITESPAGTMTSLDSTLSYLVVHQAKDSNGLFLVEYGSRFTSEQDSGIYQKQNVSANGLENSISLIFEFPDTGSSIASKVTDRDSARQAGWYINAAYFYSNPDGDFVAQMKGSLVRTYVRTEQSWALVSISACLVVLGTTLVFAIITKYYDRY
ncbi:hypothetical protein ADUPG1_007660 [Aduncisulcus paluster]|uniref:Uncharacterized protein n=1 Tax=Aduncisulcus paluster TaxID=2918883 RepID=A0ABQ5KP78_9EUKA|nr:hypothetical protein ADUPG1_007660 [Aduncisulcus paluster]